MSQGSTSTAFNNSVCHGELKNHKRCTRPTYCPASDKSKNIPPGFEIHQITSRILKASLYNKTRAILTIRTTVSGEKQQEYNTKGRADLNMNRVNVWAGDECRLCFKARDHAVIKNINLS